MLSLSAATIILKEIHVNLQGKAGGLACFIPCVCVLASLTNSDPSKESWKSVLVHVNKHCDGSITTKLQVNMPWSCIYHPRLLSSPGIIRLSEGFHDRYPVEDYLDLFDQAAYQIQGNLTANASGSPNQPNIIIGKSVHSGSKYCKVNCKRFWANS